MPPYILDMSTYYMYTTTSTIKVPGSQLRFPACGKFIFQLSARNFSSRKFRGLLLIKGNPSWSCEQCEGLKPFKDWMSQSEWSETYSTPNKLAPFFFFTDPRLLQLEVCSQQTMRVAPAISKRVVYLFNYFHLLVESCWFIQCWCIIIHLLIIKYHTSYSFVKINDFVCKVYTHCRCNVLCILHIRLLDIFLQLPTLRCEGFGCDLASPTRVKHPSRNGHELTPKTVGMLRYIYILNANR